ncbi:MAG: hypothetical protein VYA84_05235, partial [Planctomycetota bacterium]|nr:hypothetical protein [Planctomycetota bacterium]
MLPLFDCKRSLVRNNRERAGLSSLRKVARRWGFIVGRDLKPSVVSTPLDVPSSIWLPVGAAIGRELMRIHYRAS